MGKLLNVTSSVANSRVSVEYGRAQLGLDSRAGIVIIIQTNSLIAETRMTSPEMHVWVATLHADHNVTVASSLVENHFVTNRTVAE